MERRIQNPIIPGFFPDPSICRVGDDFYLICSSFELYPGIPIFHSRDLAHWQQIGHALDMTNDFHVEANVLAGGVMAPSIRYHNGVFYIINANFNDRGNFIITANDPAGPWSKPYWLDDVPGIDAALFFDEDDQAYIIGTGNVVARADGTMDRGIYICAFDIETMKCVGEQKAIFDSALRNASSPEAPHLYKIGDYYYLLIAEGGTEHYHAVSVARSRTIDGWYEGYRGNPVLTHRHLGFNYPIDNIGHADLIDTPDGNWYAVMLGSRIIGGHHKNLGRETYLCPVRWERDWPVFAPGTGKVEWSYPADNGLPWEPKQKSVGCDHFTDEELGMEWVFWGTPYQPFWFVDNSYLALKCYPRTISDALRPLRLEDNQRVQDQCVSFIGRRQQHIDFEAFCEMYFIPAAHESAGMVIMQASNHQYRIELVKTDKAIVVQLLLVTTQMDVPPYFPGFKSKTTCQIMATRVWDQPKIVMGLKARGQSYDFYIGRDKEHLECFYEGADGRLINPEIIGGMVGTILGMFASGNGELSENQALFDWFDYRGA